MRHPLKQSPRGFTLLELVIAVAVLAIGTITLMRTLDQAQRQISEAPARYLAQSVAANRAGALRAYGWVNAGVLPAEVRQGPYIWQIGTTAKRTEAGFYEVTIRVTSKAGPGARLVTYIRPGPSR